MNQIIQKIVFIPLLFLLCFQGCRKVDQELDGLNVGISAAYFPQQAVVGDSLSVSGRLHLTNNPVITLGGVEADYVFKGTEIRQDRASNTSVTIETIRFRITAEMGEGRQPLEIRSGQQVQVLYINVISRPGLGSSRPDTTLVVEELYRDPVFKAYEFTGQSVTADGVIYLQTSDGIYRFKDGQFQTLLATGDPLTINGEQVHVAKHFINPQNSPFFNSFSGVAASPDNSTLYLSVYTDMAATVEGENYTGAWLLLKTNPDLSNIEVLNQTRHRIDSVELVPGLPPFYFQYFYPAAIQDNGPIENTYLIAERLFVDAQNRLLFFNSDYYARLEENKRITAFAAQMAIFTPDGLQAFIPTRTGNGWELTLYDLELMEPAATVAPGYNWNLASFEEKPEWRFTEPTREFSLNAGVIDPYSLLGLPNGELLDMRYSSIGAFNPATASIYTFAGIEKGYSNKVSALVPEQNQLTGLAKYVNFQASTLADGFRTGVSRFIGMDNHNNIYFQRGGTGSGAFTSPLRFYRLGRP